MRAASVLVVDDDPAFRSALAGELGSMAVRAFLLHFDRDYSPMNEVYRSYFPQDRLPARTCVGVNGLARHALVEIDCIARRS